MDTYFAMLDKSTNLIKKMRNVCSKLHDFEDQCNLVLNNIQRQRDDLEENHKSFMAHTSSRIKHAPFEFMGSLYHMLFGIMDADDLKLVKENMISLLENQNEFDDLFKKQPSVIDSTENILKKTITELNENFKVMNMRVENMTELLKESYFVYKESINFFMITK